MVHELNEFKSEKIQSFNIYNTKGEECRILIGRYGNGKWYGVVYCHFLGDDEIMTIDALGKKKTLPIEE